MAKEWCPTCHKDVSTNRLALKTHRARAAARGVKCEFGQHKPGRPKGDPKVVH